MSVKEYGQGSLLSDILFFKNYLLGYGPFEYDSSFISIKDVIRFYRYRNGYFLTLLRLSSFLDKVFLGWIPRSFLNILFSSDISPGVKLGPCYFPHPFGIVIGGAVEVRGPVVIFNDVNLGKSYPGFEYGMPRVGANVLISCGSRLLGDISIGSNVVIGANSVVTKSLSDNVTYINKDKILRKVYFDDRP